MSFDLKFVYRLIGTQAFEPQFEDTMVNEPLINEFAGKFSLEACCARRGVQAKKGQLMYDHIHAQFPEVPATQASMGHYWRLAGDDPIAVEYAVGDGTSAWQLRDSQMVDIVEQELQRVWGVESRLIRVLARMTCRGIKVDTEKAQTVLASLEDQINKMMQIFPDPENASAQSGTDTKWWMEKHGITDWPTTPKTHKPSFPESWLEKSEAGRELIKIRRVMHMRNSFIRPLLDEHLWKGRVHSNFNQMRNDMYGTITGRLSSDSPNLQQAHKRDEERGRMLRGLFVPDDGMIFGEADFSQAEPRLLAHYSRCKVLMNGYLSTPFVDAHTSVAKAMYNDRWDQAGLKERKGLRETAKRVNQTIISSGGKRVIVERYGVDPRDVDKIWNDYFRAMPELRVIQKQAARRMEQRGYIKSLLGRRARLNDRSKSYVAVNRLLQCGNADMMKQKLVEFDDYLETVGRPVDVLNTIHDAADFQFDEDHRHVYNKLLEIMTDFGPDSAIPLDVPIEIEAGEGSDWGIATFGG